MKQVLFVLALVIFLGSCGGGEKSGTPSGNEGASVETTPSANPDYDPKRGEGKFKDVQVSPTLDQTLAENGNKVYGVKCGSCHKLTDERLVGPGWKGVTERRTAPWIMNFVTNTDEMLNKDPEVQAQLEICLVRMPNQNVSDDDARALYEFMRKNDGVK